MANLYQRPEMRTRPEQVRETEPLLRAQPGPHDAAGGPSPGPGRSIVGWFALVLMTFVFIITFYAIAVAAGPFMVVFVACVLITGGALMWTRPQHPGPWVQDEERLRGRRV